MGELFPVSVTSDSFHPLTDKQIIFHGVNKSGSLALSEVLRSAYRAHRRSNQFFSHYRQIPQHRNDFIDIIENSTGHAFFVGHYLYQAIQPISARILITQVRHPLPRVLSVHSWLRRRDAKEGVERTPAFRNWVKQTRGVGASQFMQFGAGYGPDSELLRKRSPEELLERAKEALERDFRCFGIAEYFEETIFLFAHLCGLPSVPPWKKDNRNSDRPLVTEVADDDLQLVREIFYRDFDFYEYARGLFLKNLESVRFGPSLDTYKSKCSDQYKDRLLENGASASGVA